MHALGVHGLLAKAGGKRDFHCPICRDCLAEWHAWCRTDESDDDMTSLDESDVEHELTTSSEVYLRFFYAARDRVTLRLHTQLRSTAATVFLGTVLLLPELSGRTLGFSQDLMASVEELERSVPTSEELAAL